MRRPRSSGRRFRAVKARAVAGSPAGLEVRARPKVLSPSRRNSDVDGRRVPRYNWRTSGSGVPAPGATQRCAAAGREWEESLDIVLQLVLNGLAVGCIY